MTNFDEQDLKPMTDAERSQAEPTTEPELESEDLLSVQERTETELKAAPEAGEEAETNKTQGQSSRLGLVLALVALLVAVAYLLWTFFPGLFVQKEVGQSATESSSPASEAEHVIPLTEEAASQLAGLEILEVEGEKVKAADLNFYAGMIADTIMQQGLFTEIGQNMLDQEIAHPNKSGEKIKAYDYILSEAKTNLVQDIRFAALAKKEGLTIPEAAEKQIEQMLASIDEHAKSQKIEANVLYFEHYGPGATAESLKTLLQRSLLAFQYRQKIYKGLDVQEAMLKEEYEAKREAYDKVSFRYFSFPLIQNKATASAAEAGSTASETTAEKTDYSLEEARQLAQNFQKLAKDEDGFKAAIEQFAPESVKRAYESQDYSLVPESGRYEMREDIASWLFEPHQEGDSTIIESESSVAVLYFIKRWLPEEKSYNSRHILIKKAEAEATATDSEREKLSQEAHDKAAKILEEYRAGEMSETRFAELAEKYSEDPGSQAQGGLYENINKGQFDPAYEKFCLDPARKAGDVDLVDSSFGTHLIYYIGEGQANWALQADQVVRQKLFKAWLEKETEAVEQHELDGYAQALRLK